jgi:hypothetical protein
MQDERRQPSFKSSSDLARRIEALPGGPQWKTQRLDFPDAPDEELILYWRDPVECLQWLEENPAFQGQTSYVPVKAYTDNEKTNRLYSEMHTGNLWAEHQANVSHFLEALTHADLTTGAGRCRHSASHHWLRCNSCH